MYFISPSLTMPSFLGLRSPQLIGIRRIYLLLYIFILLLQILDFAYYLRFILVKPV